MLNRFRVQPRRTAGLRQPEDPRGLLLSCMGITSLNPERFNLLGLPAVLWAALQVS